MLGYQGGQMFHSFYVHVIGLGKVTHIVIISSVPFTIIHFTSSAHY